MFCPNCGTKLPDDAAFCANCGTKLRTEEETNELIQNEKTASEEKSAATEVSEKVSAAASNAAAKVSAAMNSETASNVKNSVVEGANKAKTATINAVGAKRAASGPSEKYHSAYDYEAEFKRMGIEPFERDSSGKPKEYRNLLTYGLLLFLVIDIYQLYTIVRLTKFTNNDKTRSKRGGIAQLLLCMIVPFYHVYWHYNTAKRLDTLYKLRWGKESDNSVLCMILSIFGVVSWIPGLQLISMFIMQNMVNKIVGGVTGNGENSTGYGRCDQCGAEGFVDDVDHCPECGASYAKPIYRRLWFQLLVGIIVFILVWVIILSIAVG